jgi:DNA gyrase subunit A
MMTFERTSVLPSKFPNLIVNGSSGISVGMATNIPPHNMTETINALIALIDNPDTSLEELMSLLPGPDFPTSGFIYGKEGIRQAYETGKGVIQLRARAIIEMDRKGERENIVITELPYQTNKAKLIERIAELVQNKTVEGISNIRDESDREGMRVVIELKRNEVSEVILNQLFKHTQMQTSFGIILLAIHQNQPKLLLKEMPNSSFNIGRRSSPKVPLRLKRRSQGPHPRRIESHRPDRCGHCDDSGIKTPKAKDRLPSASASPMNRPGYSGDETPAAYQPRTA